MPPPHHAAASPSKDLEARPRAPGLGFSSRPTDRKDRSTVTVPNTPPARPHHHRSGRLLAAALAVALLAGGCKSTGIRLELRAGGPAVGNQTAAALMYQDPAITLGMMNPDQIIQLSASQPVVGVVAPMELDPQIILWDPKAHPTWHTIADIGQTTTKVLYFQGNTYMDYLLGSGILRRSQVDGSYDGSPAAFVAS